MRKGTLALALMALVASQPCIRCDEAKLDKGIFMHDSTRIFLTLMNNGDWEENSYNADGFDVKLLKAKNKGASLKLTVPKTGKYALYATIRGKGGFNLVTRTGLCSQAPIKKTNVFLQMEHPADLLETTTGDAFLGLFAFRANDLFELSAQDAGVEIGRLSISPVTDDEIDEYYAEKVIKPSAIIHSDGYSDFFFREITQKELEDRVVSLKKANAFAFDWCVGTSAVNYPSRITTMFGEQKSVKFLRNGDRLAAERLKKLLKESGSDPIRILRDKTREQNLRFSVTVRANPWYNSNESPLNSDYLSNHPEWMMTDVDDKRIQKPSYAYQGVREFYLGIIREVLEYRPDAITIEFLRHPPFFAFDEPLVNAYKEKYGECSKENFKDERWLRLQADVMTDWLRQVRKAIDAVDPKIALEINFDCENYYEHGIDVENLLKEGLLDLISPGFYNIGTEKHFPLKPFVEMAKASPRKVLIFPRIEATVIGKDPTPEEEKGLVKVQRRYVSDNQFMELMHDFGSEGADGLRPFNVKSFKLAEALADKTEIRNFNKYIRPLLQLRTECK
ncbi:MAG: family 10 glycosylhydrolase [Victivallales bacterium]|nr:family 10 glycosylhydrolase [Victivallales bacterium]